MFYKRLLLLILINVAAKQLGAQHTQLVVQLTLESGQPAVNAGVVLAPLTQNSTRKMLLTNDQGIISLPTDSSRYRLSATFTGMRYITDTLLADGRTDTLRYIFQRQITELATVLINSRKKIIEVKDDRFIYNVGADSSARSKSLSQVLGNLPFVTVDGTGSVQVAGQTTYKVLLNGKETALFVTSVSQAMRSFPADIVSRIELITSPGARYDAEGITAIINVITKKFAGYKGYNSMHLSNRTHFNNGFTLTGRTGKLGITVNGTISGNWNPVKSYRTTVTTPLLPSTYEQRRVSGENATKSITGSGTIELNYEIDSLRSMIAYMTADKDATDNRFRQEVNTQLTGGGEEDGFILMDGKEKSPGVTAGVDYTQKSRKNPARELAIRLNWRGTHNVIDNITTQDYASFSKWMINHSNAKNDEYTIQLDATPVLREKYTIEAGMKTIFRRASADYTSFFTFDQGAGYTKDPGNSNNFNYHQQVYAGYGSLTLKAGKNNIRAGIRVEHTDITGNFSNLPAPVEDTYLSVIPNLYWSRKTGKSTSASLAYNLNLLRPYVTNLNPFVNNTDSFNISYGNPDLGPQQIHKLVAQFRYNRGKMFVTATLTGSLSDNKILFYRIFDPSTGINALTYGNVGKEQLISIGTSINNQFSKKFRLGVWGDIRYVDIRNRLQLNQHNHGYSGIGGTYFTWDVAKRFNISGSGGLEVSNVTLLGRKSLRSFYQINTGFDIVKNKLFASVNWNNLHSNYYTQHTSFRDDTVRSEITDKNPFRVIFLAIQYTFGKLRETVARKKGVENDDIIR